MTLDSSLLGNNLRPNELAGFAEKLSTAIEHLDERAVKRIMAYARQFNSEEQAIFLRMLEEYRQAGSSSLWDMIWQLDFATQPVPFEEWCEDPYYMGKLGQELYPRWKEELAYVCHPSSGVYEWLITGCIGAGKTYAATIAQVYKGPYFLSCLKDPQGYFGLAEGSKIVFGFFNANLNNAALINFSKISQFVRQSRYFRDHCPAEIKATSITWPTKNMFLRIGSSEMHTLGSDMFGYMIDEANFMETPAEKKEEEFQAYKIYHNARRRLESRFRKFGVIPGLACIVSSRLAHTSFLEKLMEDNKDNPNSHVSDYALWDTKGRDTYSPVEFRVAIGDKYHNSKVLTELDTSSGDPFTYEIVKEHPAPQGQSMVLIPADFYFDFLRDTDGSLRDIAGVATFGANPLIFHTRSVYECAEQRPAGAEHPFLKESHELSMDDPDSNLLHYVDWRKLVRVERGAHVPLHHPNEARFVHVDLGLTGDCAAIAVGCAYDKYQIVDQDRDTGQIVERFMPKIWVDFMLQITPVRGEQIDLAKIVTFILNLRNYGFHLQRVTFDGFASEMAIQAIRKSNQLPDRKRKTQHTLDDKIDLQAEVLSVDKDDRPYRMLRDCLFQKAVNYYHYQPFIDEVLELEHNAEKQKVDHPAGGSKDVSDALCGMVYGVTTAKQYFPADPDHQIIGAEPEATVETEMLEDIMRDYQDKDRLKAIVPAPKPEPRPRKLDTGRGGWQAELDNFGRVRRDL